MVSKHMSAHIRVNHLTECVRGPRWYLVVHDGSQTHDANVHVVFLAHESGVLDGPAAGH